MLAERGHEVVSFDRVAAAEKITNVRDVVGDLTRFEDVLADVRGNVLKDIKFRRLELAPALPYLAEGLLLNGNRKSTLNMLLNDFKNIT